MPGPHLASGIGQLIMHWRYEFYIEKLRPGGHGLPPARSFLAGYRPRSIAHWLRALCSLYGDTPGPGPSSNTASPVGCSLDPELLPHSGDDRGYPAPGKRNRAR